MNRFSYKLGLILSILALWLSVARSITPQLQAAPPAAVAATQGIAYKLILTGNTYELYMRPDMTPSAPNLTLTAQVTIKVPHGTGLDRFVIADLQSAVLGTIWAASSRVDAPTEAPGFDYLSFVVDFPGGDRSIFKWTANQEIKLFSFKNSGACLGALSLIDNDTDPFNKLPNSVGTNPGKAGRIRKCPR